MAAKKKAAAKPAAKAPDSVATMGAGASEQNAKNADDAKAEPKAKAPSVEDRLSALEKAHEEHRSLAQRNGWSI